MLGYVVIVLIVCWILLFLWVQVLRRREQRRIENKPSPTTRRGPGVSPSPQRLTRIDVKVRATQRIAYMQKPNKTGAMPLLLCFHGGLGSPERFAESSDLAARALARGFLAVFPAAPEGWVDGRPELGKSTEDLDFIVALIGQLVADKLINPQRIFAVGVSNGGMFVQHLATERAGLLTGGAAVLASLPIAVAESTLAGPPMPFVLACDSGDTIMPFAGGEIGSGPGIGAGGTVVPVLTARDIWVERNGAGSASRPKRVEGPIGFWMDIYDHPADEDAAPVRFVEIQGVGHRWPRWPGIGGAPSINIADIVLDFFTSASVQEFAARQDRGDHRQAELGWGAGL